MCVSIRFLLASIICGDCAYLRIYFSRSSIKSAWLCLIHLDTRCLPSVSRCCTIFCRVLNLTVFLSGAKNTSTTLISAGATAPQASLESGANQCSYSTENYRAIKRGGAYVATIADLPQPSLYVSHQFLTGALPKICGHERTAEHGSLICLDYSLWWLSS